MSKTPYTINVDEYICTELDTIRTMIKTHDYSALLAVVERIQHHASKMEDSLYINRDTRQLTKDKGKDKELSDKEFRKLCVDAVFNGKPYREW